MKNLVFFTHQYLTQMKKKWWKLLLLFLFPMMIIGLSFMALTSIFSQNEQQKMSIAIVNEDFSSESQLLAQLIVTVLKENTYVQAELLSMEEAEARLKQNESTAAIIFPSNFAQDLYEGASVKLHVLGNPQEKTQSMVVNELVETITRYISSAQANILTVYHYAKETSISPEELESLKLELLMDFTFYTMGKSKVLREHEWVLLPFENPLHYYSFAILFCLTIIWSILLFVFLSKQTSKSLQVRLKLAGVAIWQEHVARIITTFMTVLTLSIVLFVIGLSQLEVNYYALDYFRISLFIGLLILHTIVLCAIFDIVLYSDKVKLFISLFLCVLLLAVSGAVFPTIYFPYGMQQLFPYFYTYDNWKWLTELIFEERNYASYTKSGFWLFLALSLYSSLVYVKGRLAR
ncbi:ABC transporter permease [Solibacillus sp. MA9]|uniref:ABC transporter permease n=1 Tax=Solibacillus palustris TaxID=2908203 RepID=A0ABS9UCF7_9BACL|nr:ABC transporter permease [Solibacillus sp. MA9]MCH7322025.1 ABC transporter permease [Solibacillus sp. MA9]